MQRYYCYILGYFSPRLQKCAIKHILLLQMHLSLHCLQERSHVIKTTTSTNIWMHPQKKFFLMLRFPIRAGWFQCFQKTGILDILKWKLTSSYASVLNSMHMHPSAACVTHSLHHETRSKADNDVGRWPAAKGWSWKKQCYSVWLWLHLSKVPASHLGMLHT